MHSPLVERRTNKKKHTMRKLKHKWLQNKNNATLKRQLMYAQLDLRKEKRRAKAALERRNTKKLQHAPFQEMTKALKRDQSGAKAREASKNRKGTQLDPRKFTAFITTRTDEE